MLERLCVARRRVVVSGSKVLLFVQLLHRQHHRHGSFFVVLRVVGARRSARIFASPFRQNSRVQLWRISSQMAQIQLQNPRIQRGKEDILYHLGLSSSMDLNAMCACVRKVISMRGPISSHLRLSCCSW